MEDIQLIDNDYQIGYSIIIEGCIAITSKTMSEEKNSRAWFCFIRHIDTNFIGGNPLLMETLCLIFLYGL